MNEDPNTQSSSQNSSHNSPHNMGFALPEDEAHRDRLAEIGQLASGLVHELKNPLGAISLTMDMILQQCHSGGTIDSDKLEKRAQRVADSTKQLDNIIASFLSFARPKKAEHARVDINELLQHIIHEQEELFQQGNIDISFRPSEDLRAVPADVTHLRMIFLNIIVNAHDALLAHTTTKNARKQVIIMTRNGQDSIRIMIANNGPSLDSSAAAHLFDPFYSAKDGGTGLGLAIVKRLVDFYNGKVHVTSDPDQGVNFTIEFPTGLGPARTRDGLPEPSIPVDFFVHESDS